MRKYFREPKDFESTLWLSQITQGYGIKYGAEGWRREMPEVDGLRLLAVQRLLALLVVVVGRLLRPLEGPAVHGPPVLCAAAGFRRRKTSKGRKVDLYVTSDRREDCQGTVQWTVTDLSGDKLGEGSSISISRPERAAWSASLDLRRPRGETRREEPPRVAETGRRRRDGLRKPRHAGLSAGIGPAGPGPVGRDCRERPGEFAVTLRAEHPALWTWLELDGVDARFSDNFVHISPARPVTISVRPAAPMTKDAFQRALKIRSLYDTYKQPAR